MFKRKKIKSLLYFVSCFTPFADISGGSGSEDTFKPRGAWMCILTFLSHTTNDLWMGPVHGVHLAYLFLEDENQVTLTKKDCFPEQCHYLDVQRIATLGCPVDTFFSLHLKNIFLSCIQILYQTFWTLKWKEFLNWKLNGGTDKFLILCLFLLSFRQCFTPILTKRVGLWNNNMIAWKIYAEFTWWMVQYLQCLNALL